MGSDSLFHHRALVVEGLLNALEAERHLRRPLVVELIESLSNPEKEAARRLLTRLGNHRDEPLSDREWKAAIDRLRDDIAPPASVLPTSGVMVRKTTTATEKKVA